MLGQTSRTKEDNEEDVSSYPVSRRTCFRLTTTALSSVLGFTSVSAAQGVSRQATVTYPIRPGTKEETTVYVTEAPKPGPTVMIVGGQHGNEEAGYTAGEAITDWNIDAGKLVIIPRANRPAIRQDSYGGLDGNLNRHFPAGERPESDLARSIWNVVLEHQPDFLWDLHSSKGIYSEGTGVGQAIFPTAAGDAATQANALKAYLNRSIVDDYPDRYQFTGYNQKTDGKRDMLIDKIGADLATPAAIFETTRDGLDLETQVTFTTAAVRRFLERYGLLESGTRV
ncbi:deacylase [halophilic archaeon]|nr:deacylase [halophilic archaeon]